MSSDSPLLTLRNLRSVRWCRVAVFTALIPGAVALNAVQVPPSSYVRKYFTIEDGLPDSYVNAIVQSQNGYLWIGTQGGLARFDGEHFTLVRLRGENSREVPVNTLLSAPDGDLWVGTDSGLEHVPKAAVDHFDSTLVKLYSPGAGLSGQVECLHLLGDHLKTGHTLSLQNRPTEVGRRRDCFTLPQCVFARRGLGP